MKRNLQWAVTAVTILMFLFNSAGVSPRVATAQAEPGENNKILLQYGVIDTRAGEPGLSPGLRIDSFPSDQPGYYFVQFSDIILPEWKAALEAAGCDIFGYVPNNAYLVRMGEEVRDQVAQLPNVQWVGLYQPAYRLSPAINSLAWENEDQKFLILTFPGAGLETIAAQVQAAGGEILEQTENEWQGTLFVTAGEGLLPVLAQINGVMWIEPWKEPVLTNDISRGIMDVQDTVWGVQGLYGAGQVVAVADTGLDVGTTSAALNDDFEGRIIATFALGRTDNWSDPNGHGTHVAGSVLGNGINSGSTPGSHAYNGSYAGLAPEASLVFQSTMSADGRLGGLPADLNTLFQQALDAGAHIHTNSWGWTSSMGEYNSNSLQADQFSWNHPEFTILFAAGNDGVDANSDGKVDTGSVSAPATAKNVITVGASESDRSSGGYSCLTWGGCWATNFPANPIFADAISNNTNGLAAFSGRGPTDSGRIKPDIVAPGTDILSVRTHQHSHEMTVESGANGWTMDLPWAIIDADAHQGTHSWSTGSYGTNTNASITSPLIDIRTEAKTISYYTHFDFGLGDSGVVEYSNDGTTWILCDTVNGAQNSWVHRSCNINTGWGLTEWTQTQLQNLRIRFRLSSDWIFNGTGWWVDDILVTPEGWGFTNSTNPDLDYMYMGGTSMATPLVAGGAALVREYYTDRNHVPTSALIKATLVNGAVNMQPGQYGTGTTQEIGGLPNNDAGWGRVNLQESLFPTDPVRIQFRDIANASGLQTNQFQSFRYRVQDTSVPFRATMVYTDFPAQIASGGANITNNLNMEILAPDGTTLHYPNGLTGADGSNNTEDIFIPQANVQSGVYTITIRGQNIPNGPQGYALVVRGGDLVPALNIAVNPSGWDNIGAILTTMGYPWTQIYDTDINTYANIAGYDIIYANCSSAALDNGPNAAASLQEFVQNGGSFYASDFAFTYIRSAFPSHVTFFSDPHIGSSGIVTGDITDPGLASYIDPTNPPATIELNYNLGGWVPVDTVPSTTTVHIRGDIPTYQGTLNDKPLVVSFAPYSNSSGRVIYTTFHNEAQISDIERKLLEYLVLVPVSSPIRTEAEETVRSNGVEVKQVNLATINQGVTSPQVSYPLSAASKLVFALNWAGSSLGLTIFRPDGSQYAQVQSSSPPIAVVIPSAEAGSWKYQVTGIEVPYDNYPYVVAIGDNNDTTTKTFLPAMRYIRLETSGFNSQFKGSSSGWVPASGSWYVDSEYYYTYGTVSNWASASYNALYTTLDYQARLWRYGCTSCSYGVVVRGNPLPQNVVTGFDSGYAFFISRNGYYAVFKFTGSTTYSALSGWTYSSSILQGDNFNTVRVIAKDTQLYFYINNRLVWSGSDSGITFGQVGVTYYAGSDGNDSFFVDWATLTPQAPFSIERAVPLIIGETEIKTGGDDPTGPVITEP